MVAYDTDLVNLFRSERLVYRALEKNDEDKAYIQENHLTDSVYLGLADMDPILPRSKETTTAWIERATKAMLAVLICLPPAPADNTSSKEANDATAPSSPAKKEEKPKPTPIGFIVLFSAMGNNVAHHRSASIGISIATRWRGQRYGGEAINWALDWAFRRQGLHRVAIGGLSFNPNALKLYRSLGFVEEGREREAVYFDRGWHDLVSLGMLEHEWARLRGLKE